jgi:hypothetical protein
MNNLLFVIIIGVIMLISGCNSTPVSVEFSKVCELQNDGKYLETTGYLDNIGDLYCSGKQGGNMTCGMEFKKDENFFIDINKSISSELNPTEVFRVNVLLGDSANSLKKKEYAHFKKEDMEFIGNDNSIITIKNKVKITGKARVNNDPTLKAPANPLSCSINVDKIEKQ